MTSYIYLFLNFMRYLYNRLLIYFLFAFIVHCWFSIHEMIWNEDCWSSYKKIVVTCLAIWCYGLDKDDALFGALDVLFSMNLNKITSCPIC